MNREMQDSEDQSEYLNDVSPPMSQIPTQAQNRSTIREQNENNDNRTTEEIMRKLHNEKIIMNKILETQKQENDILRSALKNTKERRGVKRGFNAIVNDDDYDNYNNNNNNNNINYDNDNDYVNVDDDDYTTFNSNDIQNQGQFERINRNRIQPGSRLQQNFTTTGRNNNNNNNNNNFNRINNRTNSNRIGSTSGINTIKNRRVLNNNNNFESRNIPRSLIYKSTTENRKLYFTSMILASGGNYSKQFTTSHLKNISSSKRARIENHFKCGYLTAVASAIPNWQEFARTFKYYRISFIVYEFVPMGIRQITTTTTTTTTNTTTITNTTTNTTTTTTINTVPTTTTSAMSGITTPNQNESFTTQIGNNDNNNNNNNNINSFGTFSTVTEHDIESIEQEMDISNDTYTNLKSRMMSSPTFRSVNVITNQPFKRTTYPSFLSPIYVNDSGGRNPTFVKMPVYKKMLPTTNGGENVKYSGFKYLWEYPNTNSDIEFIIEVKMLAYVMFSKTNI